MELFAKKQEMPEVYKNWEEGFGDSKEDILSFFEVFKGKVRVCVLRKDGHVAAQLCLIPVRAGQTEAEYLYAVTTNRAYRGQGACSLLLEKVCSLLNEEGKCGILVPADIGLVSFYEKRGFTKFCEEQIFCVKSDSQYRLSICPCTIEEYISLRDRMFFDENGVKIPECMAEYAIAGYLADGYRCATVLWEDTQYGILYRDDEKVLIQEITVPNAEKADRMARAFLAQTGKKEALFRYSYLTLGIHLPEKKSDFFNLVLD